METTKNATRYPEELRARAVRMVWDHETEIREQIGGNPVDFSDGWVQQGQLADPLPGRASHCNVPRGGV